MIQLAAHYQLISDDFAMLDAASDALMDALMLDETIKQPDVALSLTEMRLEVWLNVDTSNPQQAISIGVQALNRAFTVAGLVAPPSAHVRMHQSLLGPAAEFKTELAPA